MAISVFFRLLVVIPGLGFAGYNMYRTFQNGAPDRPLSLLSLFFVAVIYLISWRWQTFFDNFRLPRSPMYRARLHKELANLQARLS